jgi:hypothetical protein
MGGRASLIMVIGFAIIFGIINLNLAKLTNRSVGNMVGYNESSISRLVAYSGAHNGLAMYTSKPKILGTIINKNFTDGPFKNSGYTVTLTNMPSSSYLGKNYPAYLRLMCVSRCTTFVRDSTMQPYVLRDTVIVRMDTTTTKSFSKYGWLTDNEGNVFFIDGDTLWGKVHSNGNIHIDSDKWGHHPTFMGKVTTSGKVDPTTNYADFKVGGKAEEHVPEVPLPTNITEAIANASNRIIGLDGSLDNRNKELWVEIKPGTSGDNDGYAIIWKGANFSGAKVDSMTLSDASEKVIYSSQTVHVKGTLDGQLSIASGVNVKIEGNTVYERPPDPNTQIAGSSVNSTKDVLGLISNGDVQISDDFHGNLYINAAIYAGQGSFGAENYNTRAAEGTIYLIGSICQKDRGAVGTFNSGTHTLKTGYLKHYRYDNRFNPDEDGFEADKSKYGVVSDMHPPSYPVFTATGPLAIKSWWESSRKAFIVDEYYQ